VALEKAMQTDNWYPDMMVFAPNFYDPTFTANGGSALKSSYTYDAYVPFELAAQNPPTAQYVNIMKAEVASPKISAIGVQGWDAWLLFATAAKACGSNLTRQCLLQQASAQTAWTGGGLAPPVHPQQTNAQATDCSVILQASASGFAVSATALAPTPGHEPFNCDPANVVHLKNNYEPTDLPAGFQPAE
jgi:hypothetical protein